MAKLYKPLIKGDEMETKTELSHSESQAKAQFESISEMVEELKKAQDNNNDEEIEQTQTTIQEDALSVQVRSGWSSPGELTAEEYEILLCWGGPACRIIGDLDEYDQPNTAQLQHQDWGTNWIDYLCEEKILLEYAQQFYFAV